MARNRDSADSAGGIQPDTSPAPAALAPAQSPEDVAAARQLFVEYAESLGFDLCFQHFDQELAGLPGSYAPPSGRLLLARVAGRTAGCAALRQIAPGAGELKRMYVRPEFRGLGLGRMLASGIIAEARAIGYQSVRLDTVPQRMPEASALYRSLGFREIPPYYENPIPGVVYMELTLQQQPGDNAAQ